MQTLVLSAAWEPMEIVPWQRAITLWFLEKAEVIEEYEDRQIHTVDLAFQMPSVVRLPHTLRTRKRHVRFSRQNVWMRDKGRCQYCRSRVPRHTSTFDHVVPRAQGGATRWDNIVTACFDCNQRKGNRTPAKAGMRLAMVPVKPRSLPGNPDLTMTYQPGMPLPWKQFLRDVTYWHGELDPK